MRIAMVVGADNNTGGVERMASLLTSALQRVGHEVHQVPPGSVKHKIFDKLGLAPIIRSWSARRAIKSLSPDLVITHGSLGFVGFRWKHIHVFHGTLPAHHFVDRDRPLRDWLFRGVMLGGLSEFLSGLGAVRVGVSESVRNEVKRFYNFTTHSVIPNGVPTHPGILSQPRESDLVLFVGRPESRKGFETAVAVCADNSLVLSVAGPSNDDRVNCLGVLDKSSLDGYLYRASAMLFPTKYEACSLAILEAIAAGCPVVTTDVGWVKELIEQVPEYKALVSEPSDWEGLSNSLKFALANGPELQAITRVAKVFVESNNSLERFSERWSQLVREQENSTR